MHCPVWKSNIYGAFVGSRRYLSRGVSVGRGLGLLCVRRQALQVLPVRALRHLALDFTSCPQVLALPLGGRSRAGAGPRLAPAKARGEPAATGPAPRERRQRLILGPKITPWAANCPS